MNNFIFSLLAGNVPNPENYPVPEDIMGKLMYGLKVTLVGLGTVFFVLFVLMVVLYVFRLIFYTIPKKRESSKNTAEITPVENASAASSDEDEDEIAAVIAAAIASVYNVPSAQARQKYKIKSFKRI